MPTIHLDTAFDSLNPHPLRLPSMPSTAKPYRDPALDGLRGLAVLLVYIAHYGGGLKSHNLLGRLFGYITAAGWTGVILFFALSGFLITGILWDSIGQHNWLRNFYARRVLRIFPLYYAVLALCAIVMVATGRMFYQLRMLYLYAFFLQDLPRLNAMAQLVPSLPLYHLWSLAVEEQFYLLWPFLLLIFGLRNGVKSPRRALHLCLWTFVVSAVYRTAIFGLPHLFSGQTAFYNNTFLLTHAGPLALGAAIAIALRYPATSSLHTAIRRFALPAFLLGLAAYLASSLFVRTLLLMPRSQFVFGLPAVSLAAAAAIPLVLRTGCPRRLCSSKALRFLGKISYGFYVFHILFEPVFDAIGRHFAHTSSGSFYQFVRLIAAFPITVAISWLSFQLLETPFLQLKRHFPMHSAIPTE